MADRRRILVVALVVGVALGSAAFGSATVSYLTDREHVDYEIRMPEDPDASVATTNPIDEGERVRLTGANSSDDTGIASYRWDVEGDGSVEGAGAVMNRTYADSGDHEVTLIVTDETGLTDNATTTVTVRNVPPTAEAGESRTVDAGASVRFDASGSTDPGMDRLRYHWQFGDGETGLGVSPTHNYTESGNYTVTLTVRDGDGGVDSDTTSVTVRAADNEPPVAEFEPSTTRPKIGETVEFDASGSTDDVSVVDYEWDFGDGTTASGRTAAHSYANGGTYPVRLTVTDGEGRKDTYVVPIRVGLNPVRSPQNATGDPGR